MIGIYCRVAREVHPNTKWYLDEQIEQCKQKAVNAEVTLYIDNGFSGANLKRPKLTQLRTDVDNGLINHIIVYSHDRLARNISNLQMLKDEFNNKNVHVTFVV